MNQSLMRSVCEEASADRVTLNCGRATRGSILRAVICLLPVTVPAVANPAWAAAAFDPAPVPVLTSISPNNGPINSAAQITLTGTGFVSNSVVSLNGVEVTATFVDSTTLTVSLPSTAIQLPGNNYFTVTTPQPGGGTSASALYTSFISIAHNDMIYDAANNLLYVSVPGEAGAPYGDCVVPLDPATGTLGRPIFVGSEPNHMAITADGRYLWVGLDGAAAVRKIDLTTKTAGRQFSLGGNSGIYANPGTALALAALPGAPDSVLVAATTGISNLGLSIYDNGVPRGKPVLDIYLGEGTNVAIQVDGTKEEVYFGTSEPNYDVYKYSPAGLTLKASNNSGPFVSSVAGDLQLADGRIYMDSGTIYGAESGKLVGAFYAAGTNAALGPVFVDTTLDKAFVLDGKVGSQELFNQIQVFNPTAYDRLSNETTPVNIGDGSLDGYAAYPSRLLRWGIDGLAFQTSSEIYTLHSKLVKNLSNVSADLSVALVQSGHVGTGADTVYTATISNAGPEDSTDVTLAAVPPPTGFVISATPSTGSCPAGANGACDLGSLARGATASVRYVIQQFTAGDGSMTVQVSGPENDPDLANNQATAAATIAGATYNQPPSIASISPAFVQAGSDAVEVTVTGTGFVSGAAVLLNGEELATSWVSSTSLTATVPKEELKSLGWSEVSVSNPGPGGGASNQLTLTIYSVIALDANHILYDPFSRRIMASVRSAASRIKGNSIVAINPNSGSVGAPVPIGSQPTNMALTSDGQILYTVLAGSRSVARYNMLTDEVDYKYQLPSQLNSFPVALRGVAAQPGTEDTVALDLGEDVGNALYDFDPEKKTAAIRGGASGSYTGSCIQFLNAKTMLSYDIDTSGSTLNHYIVSAEGFGPNQFTGSTLYGFGCFKLSGGLAFGETGGVANPATVPATQIGLFENLGGYGFPTENDVEPDSSLQKVFFLLNSETANATANFVVFDESTYLSTLNLPMDLSATEGSSGFTSLFDLIRWGQDGLAALTASGHLYLFRGPVVVPKELGKSSAARIAASSASTLKRGTGNTLLTLTGTSFQPGVAVEWNGEYRTTTVVNPAQVTVAIPASDLEKNGTASLVAINPGAVASRALKITIE